MPIGACPVAPDYTVGDTRMGGRGSHCNDTCKTQSPVIRASESTGHDTEGLQPARPKGWELYRPEDHVSGEGEFCAGGRDSERAITGVPANLEPWTARGKHEALTLGHQWTSGPGLSVSLWGVGVAMARRSARDRSRLTAPVATSLGHLIPAWTQLAGL